jgi:hypothetical protein
VKPGDVATFHDQLGYWVDRQRLRLAAAPTLNPLALAPGQAAAT